MVLHKVNQIDLGENELGKIDCIKCLKNEIDSLCNELIQSLYDDGISVEIAHDIMYESELVDIVGRITVNKYIKTIYRNY